MTDPYELPKIRRELERLESKKGYKEPIIGCWVGGCCIPTILLLLCAAFLGDTGGPLIWPILSIVLGLLGLFLGIGIRSVK